MKSADEDEGKGTSFICLTACTRHRILDSVLPYMDYATYITDGRVFVLAVELALAGHCSKIK